MNTIDQILYINLDSRYDRKEHILNEINKICVDNTKIYRIQAIKKEEGAMGCLLSHIKALEYILAHSEWNTILILEDDFTFKSSNSNEILHDIEILTNNAPNFDMCLLSSNQRYLKYEDTNNFRIKKVLFSQTSSSYIIKRHYIPILLNNFKEALHSMELIGVQHSNCLDQYWASLQTKDNWYVIYPPIGYQYENYSDIEHRVTNYKC